MVITNVPVREALNWWARTTKIALIVDWRRLELKGIDPETPTHVRLQRVRADVLLSIMLRQLTAYTPIMYQITSGYVEVMIKEQVNRRLKMRVYDVADPMLQISRFGPEPRFDRARRRRDMPLEERMIDIEPD